MATHKISHYIDLNCRRTKFGGKFIEEVCPPKDYIYYYEGMPKQRIYEVRSYGNSRDNE